MPPSRARSDEPSLLLSVVLALAVVTVVACSGYELELPRPGGLRTETASHGAVSPAVTLSRVVAAPAPTEVVAAVPAVNEAVAAPVVALKAPGPAPVAVVAPIVDETPSTPLELVATAREVIVYAEPARSAQKLGYLRLGARVTRGAEPAGYEGCPRGFYAVAPGGFVCAGNAASLEPNHPLAALARTRADRGSGLPYVYGRSKPVPAPLYRRLPSKAETAAFEGAAPRPATGWDDLVAREAPEYLAGGQSMPEPVGYARVDASVTSRAVPDSSFALLDVIAHEGRSFGVTTDLELVPLDRLTRVAPSEFSGVVLGEAMTLPLVFVRARHALLLAGSPERGFRPARPLQYREALPLSGNQRTFAGVRYLETKTGDWLRDVDLVRVDAPARMPPGAGEGKSWIAVSVLKQTLVALVGSRPVYATLVSTGSGGLGDPETTHATPRGEFRIHTKHVSATMSGEEVGDEYDLRDVPYVQYFTGGYAFHAAHWHDAFGVPHSHGCVNLSPADARWLFHFSEPAVPQGWHGAFSREGTLVSISP
jgi:hypothetical protein